MSEIGTSIGRIPLDGLRRLEGLRAIKLSEEDAAALRSRLKDIEELRYRIPEGPPDEVYAEVKVGGKVVATLYNSGAAVTSNALSGQLRRLPSMGEGCHLTGPALAQLRAEEIAEALGGTVAKAETALTQAQWRARPPTSWAIDHEAMARDRAAAAAREASAATLVQAQMEAQAQAGA